MKTISAIINHLTSLLTENPNRNELMPRLIPVRVITNRILREKNP